MQRLPVLASRIDKGRKGHIEEYFDNSDRIKDDCFCYPKYVCGEEGDDNDDDDDDDEHEHVEEYEDDYDSIYYCYYCECQCLRYVLMIRWIRYRSYSTGNALECLKQGLEGI